MKKMSFLTIIILMGCAPQIEKEHFTTSFRAPAYPLITIDPYTSAWSMADHLYDEPVKHWTGKVFSLIGAIRVDGKTYRFMGKEETTLKPIIPMAKDSAWEGSYVRSNPGNDWYLPSFNDARWANGLSAFGSEGMKAVGTIWEDDEIWVRRKFNFPKTEKQLYLIYSHDDDMELYINGKEMISTGRSAKQEVILEIDPDILNQGGENLIAAHCLDRGGLAYVDFGIYTNSDIKKSFTNPATQTGVSLTATQTIYQFDCGPVALDLTFTSPLLMDDLDVLSRPVNYVDYTIKSKDESEHEVQVYFEITPQWAVNELSQEVEVTSGTSDNVSYLKTGTTEQPVLEKKGDNIRIDWGYAYLSSVRSDGSALAISEYSGAKNEFNEKGSVTNRGDTKAILSKQMPVLSYTKAFDRVDNQASTGSVMIAYDDRYSIQYFGENLKAWWAQGGEDILSVLQKASNDHDLLIEKCMDFDNQMWANALEVGGKEYADLCVLAYRQSIAAHKLSRDTKGNILFLSKENFSNGSIGTVDVTYPSAPLYLEYNPDLLKGMLNPIFYYSESGKWDKPFAAHDVGTYPLANGQTYGGDMPVEECGNMLILTAAIANKEGNAVYAGSHWDILTTWANYLMDNGLDPENQLCTDDFAGHFAHNANLSIKAIMGIASYGKLAEMLGKNDIAEKYLEEAKRMAVEWEKMANDGDHYRLTFDKENTWSQKYNLVWDKLLHLGIFPKEIVSKEIPYYLYVQNEYGLPLDIRRTYTKSDWIVWTATLADDMETFQKFIVPLHKYVTHTPDRVPNSDWYETKTAEQVGFQARSVVGGYFIKMLDN
ncbi:MAG: glutaminase domain-containing protein [Bacteroidota bacterium]